MTSSVATSRHAYVANDGESSTTLPIKRPMMSNPGYGMVGQPIADFGRASVVSDGDGDTATSNGNGFGGNDFGGLATNVPTLSVSSSSSLLSQDDLDPIATAAEYGYPSYMPTSVTAPSKLESESVTANSVLVGEGSGTGELEVGAADWASAAGTFSSRNASNTDTDRFGRAEFEMCSEGDLTHGAARASMANYGGNNSGSSPSASNGTARDMLTETEGTNHDADIAEVAEVMDTLREFANDFEERMGQGKFWEDLDIMASEQSRRNAGLVG